MAQLMRQHGIVGVTRRRSPATTKRVSGAPKGPGLVQRGFTADHPDVLWVADVTYVPTGSRFLYLAVVLDIFSRRENSESEVTLFPARPHTPPRSTVRLGRRRTLTHARFNPELFNGPRALKPLRQYPHLDKAPVVEAILDFAASFDDAMTADALHVDPSILFDGGASGAPIRTITADARLTSGAEDVTINSGVVGYRYENSDGDRVAQFRVNGMTYSSVGSYSAWESLVEESLRAFGVYQRIAGDPVPVRISTRFINRIAIPFERSLADFLRVLPGFPIGVTGGIMDFGLQTSIRDDGTRVEGTFNLFTEPTESSREGSIIIDVTAGIPESYTIPNTDDVPGPVLDVLGKIRDFKNQLFFGALTPYTVDLYRDES